MGIPQAPTVKAPKILARPSDAPKASAGNQPLFTKQPAQSKFSSRASKPTNLPTHQPTMILKKGTPKAKKGFSASAPEYHPPGFGSSFSVSDGSHSSAGSAGQQYRSVPPPGFRQQSVPKAAETPAAAAYVEPNHLGTIRASAREFVPTSFSTSPVPEVNVVPSMSAQSTTKPPSFPKPPSTSSSKEPSNAPAAAASSLIEPMSSLLSTVRSTSPTPGTLAPTIGVDTTVSAASSITGLSGALSEEKPTSRVGSIMTFESNTATGGLQGSSILDTINYGATEQSNGLGSGSIWGGTGTTTQSDTLGGLGGLNFSSFMNDDSLSNNKGEKKDTWGNGAIGGGSIW